MNLFISRPLLSSLRNASCRDIHLSGSKGREKVPKLTLFTGTDCQLCDVAKAVLDEIGKSARFDLQLYNIRDDSLPDVQRWRRAYQYDIPVLHLEGTEIARHRLNKTEVEEKIKALQDQN